MYMNVHSSIIHNSKKVKTNQMFNHRLMDKQNVVYPQNGILLSHIKESSTDRCCNIDEP